MLARTSEAKTKALYPRAWGVRQQAKSIYLLPLYFNCHLRSSAVAEENETTRKVCVNVTFLFLHPQHLNAQSPDSSIPSV